MKKQKLRYRILTFLADLFFNIRQDKGLIGRLQYYFDEVASHYHCEAIDWHNFEIEQAQKKAAIKELQHKENKSRLEKVEFLGI